MRKQTLFAASALIALACNPAIARDSRFRADDAYDLECSDESALAVVYDLTSTRRDDEKAVAAKLLFHIENFALPGRGVAYYHDRGNGAPIRYSAMCRPTACSDKHVILRRIEGDNRVCTQKGYENALALFEKLSRLATLEFFSETESQSSDIFGSLASVADDLRAVGYSSGEIIMVSDGLPNFGEAVYSSNAPWLHDDAARTRLLEHLNVRGAKPDLSGFSVHFVLAGRPLGSAARMRGEWLTPEENSSLEAFWRWFATETNASLLTWEGDFIPEHISSLNASAFKTSNN